MINNKIVKNNKLVDKYCSCSELINKWGYPRKAVKCKCKPIKVKIKKKPVIEPVEVIVEVVEVVEENKMFFNNDFIR